MFRPLPLLVGGAFAVLLAPSLRAQRPDTLPLSLTDAVGRALHTGDETRIAQAQVDLTEAQVTTARAAGLPQLRVTVTQSHVLENARAQAVGAIFNQPDTYNANANLSFAAFQGGRVSGARTVAHRANESAQLTAEETLADVTLNVLRAYVQALFADRLVAIRRGSLALIDSELAQVEEFEGAGRSSPYDVLRTRVQRANLEPTVVDAVNARDIAVLQLKRLTNIETDQPLRLTTTIDTAALSAMVVAADAPSPRELDERAALRAAELAVEGRHAAVTVARADLLPTVTFSLQSGYQAFPPSGGFPTSFGHLVTIPCPAGSAADRVCTGQNGGWFSDRTIGTTISVPIFDGLRAKGNIAVAQSQERLAELQLAEEHESIAIDVAEARAELGRAKSFYSARRENASQAGEAYSIASLRFSRGVGTQLEIADAQLALLTAQTDEARSVFDLYLAVSGVERALGRPIPLPAERDVASAGASIDPLAVSRQ